MTFVVISAIMIGSTIVISVVYAQNQTATPAQSFAASTDALLLAAIGIISAALALIKTFVDRGLLDKRIGTAVVMAADAAVAIKDNRQSIKDLAQNTYEVVQLTSPEAATAMSNKIQPVLNQATQRINEYTPKVEKFGAIANAIGKDGDKTTDEIKAIRKTIPDSIVSD